VIFQPLKEIFPAQRCLPPHRFQRALNLSQKPGERLGSDLHFARGARGALGV
jgi:hypothetical protein